MLGELPSSDRSSSSFSFGSIVRMSDNNGESARAFVMSSRSTLAVSSDSSNAGAFARVSPRGPITSEPPWNMRPPSLPTRLPSVTNTPCSSAMSRISRSQRATLPGTEAPSVRSKAPRAGEADETNTTCAPSSAAINPVSECHASSHTSIAARPQGASNARIEYPRSTNRSSSKRPYVGRNVFR